MPSALCALGAIVTRLALGQDAPNPMVDFGAVYNALMYKSGRWRRYDVVDQHVVLGALPRPEDFRELDRLGVGLLVNLCEEDAGDREALEAHGMRQIHLPTKDHTSPSQAQIDEALGAIDAAIEAGVRTYVHCRVGKGRSATVAICYLVRREGLSPEAAEQRLRLIRPQIDRKLHRREVVKNTAAAR